MMQGVLAVLVAKFLVLIAAELVLAAVGVSE